MNTLVNDLIFKPYKKGYILQGDRKKYQNLARNLGGRWNSKPVNEEPGWIINKEREAELLMIFEKLSNTPVKEAKKIEILSPQSTTSTPPPSIVKSVTPPSRPVLDVVLSNKPMAKKKPVIEDESDEETLPTKPIQATLLPAEMLHEVSKRPKNIDSIKPRLTLKSDPIEYFKSFALEPRDFRRFHGVAGSVCSDSSIDSGDSAPEYSPPHKYLASPVTPGKHREKYAEQCDK